MPTSTKRKTTQLSVNVNKRDKDIATKMFSHMGLNMSSAVNMFLKQVIAQGKIPFTIKDPYFHKNTSAELNHRMNQIIDHHQFKKHHLNV